MKIKNKNYKTDFFDFQLEQANDQQLDIAKEKVVFYISNSEYLRIKGLFVNRKILKNSKTINKDYAYYSLVMNTSKAYTFSQKISQSNWNNSVKKYLLNF